ncbi:MAG: ABC transporter ATP-binding protein [Fimbriimonadaceae bacterium]|nr:ABC transporter ATP-binding protein [Fimbriimonadaceae bacterium]
MAELRVERLSVHYGDEPVLREVNLAVSPGECVALLGPNGAGKSTLLLSVLGAIPAVSGSVTMGGVPLSDRSAKARARAFAYVPQDSAIPFDYRVRDFVAMGRFPHAAGLFETHEDWRAIADAMAQAECAAFADRRLSELSGGERQRVALARAIAQAAPIWLLDEPTSHLDIAHQRQLVGLARQHVGRGGSVIAVVHDINLATDLADRIVLLQRGVVRLDAPVDEALASPVLDEVFESHFQRLDADGRMVVIPARHR